MATRTRGEQVGITVAFLLALILSVGAVAALARWARSPACSASCRATAAEDGEPMLRTATPRDGLTRFGALEAVWNYYHPLSDPGSWGEAPEGYLPATAADRRNRVLVTIDDRPRVTYVQFFFSLDPSAPTDVDLSHGRALVTPELPTDAVQVDPAAADTEPGCVDSDLYRSAAITRALGNVLVRVQYEPDPSQDSLTLFDEADIHTVPTSDPCVITAS